MFPNNHWPPAFTGAASGTVVGGGSGWAPHGNRLEWEQWRALQKAVREGRQLELGVISAARASLGAVPRHDVEMISDDVVRGLAREMRSRDDALDQELAAQEEQAGLDDLLEIALLAMAA